MFQYSTITTFSFQRNKMTKKDDLLKIAKYLENKFVELEIDDPAVTDIFAIATSSIEKIASTYETPVDGQTLEELAAIASAFDMSGDSELQAEARAIDQVLFAIAAPGEALYNFNLVYDKELEELRKARRAQDLQDKYTKPKEQLDEMYGHKSIADSVEKNVRRYRPLEAPLSTRYSPDRPGVSLMRITDRVYQDP